MSLDADLELPAGSLSTEQRRLSRRALTMLAVLGSGSMAGVAFSLYLVNHFPLLLVALSPLGRHIVLAAPLVDPLALVLVAVARRLLFYNASYDLGRALGASGIVWLERRAAYFGRWVRWIEQLFGRAPRVVVLVTAGPTISALAGSTGMRQSVFLPLATLSLAFRMLLILGFAELLREQIEELLTLIDAYWKPGTALMIVGVLAYRWYRIRQRRGISSGAG